MAKSSNNPITWYLDDNAAYRVAIHKTAEGNLTTKQINGAIFIFNPTTGQLFLKVLHTSEWHEQKRLGSIAKWKAADFVVALVQSLPVEARPTEIIVTREGIVEPLKVRLLDHSLNIVVEERARQLPLQGCLKMAKFGDRILKATGPQLDFFYVYDDWLKSLSSKDAFLRLVLILKALDLHTDEAKRMLLFNSDAKTITATDESNRIWPYFSDEHWMKVEVDLRDIVLSDYAEKHHVNLSALTPSEILGIILEDKDHLPFSTKTTHVSQIQNQQIETTDI